MKDKELFLRCECHAYHFVELHYDPEYKELSASFIETGSPSFWGRVKDAWKVLKGEKYYFTEIILKAEDHDNLEQFFKEVSQNETANTPRG